LAKSVVDFFGRRFAFSFLLGRNISAADVGNNNSGC